MTAACLGIALASSLACVTARNYPDPDGPVYEGSFARGPRALSAPQRLRVVTFNIEYGAHVEQAIALLRMRPELAQADVLLLQEMDAVGVERVAHELGLGYVYCPSSYHIRLRRDIGEAILSPWPFESRAKVLLPHLSRFSGHARAAVSARLRVGQRFLRVYSLHLGTPINLSASARRDQLDAVVADAARFADPVLVGGDFNGKSMADYLSRRAFAWPTRAVGPTSTLFRYSFDHVLARGFTTVDGASSGVVRDARGVSYHFPVWTVLRFE